MIKRILNYYNTIGLHQKARYLNRKIFVRENDFKKKKNQLDFHLDKIRDYFGENVAFYFAFLEFYTKALIPSALLGKKSFIKKRHIWLCSIYLDF